MHQYMAASCCPVSIRSYREGAGIIKIQIKTITYKFQISLIRAVSRAMSENTKPHCARVHRPQLAGLEASTTQTHHKRAPRRLLNNLKRCRQSMATAFEFGYPRSKLQGGV